MWSSNPYPRELPKTQTTSLLAARFQRFSPRWSAFWAPHYLEPRPRRRQSGGIAPCKGATRRRHAARRLRMAQNPHYHTASRQPGWHTPPNWIGYCVLDRLISYPEAPFLSRRELPIQNTHTIGGSGGPGCGARGRWRGLAGLRGDAPSEARGAGGSRAGRPRAHQAARPHNAAARPQPGYATKSSPSEPCARAGASRPSRSGCGPRCAAPRLRCR